MAYGDAKGYMPLREAIAEYLGAARAVRCEPSQILVTTGSQQGLQLSAQVLLDTNERVWVEEHQYPLGVTMTATRRMLLLQWAMRTGAWIIEDDYDSEYRLGGRPIAALQGLDTDARVIYIGTFSKVMFPALRLGYVVVPKDLVEAFSTARDATDQFSSTLYQAALADFIREGHFARHIRRMRMLYILRRTALVEAIRQRLSDKLTVIGAEAGMHLVALLPRGVSDVAISLRAAEMGVSAMPLSSCYAKPPLVGGLILGYGGTDARQIHDGIRRLAMCI
jgi:GntR family transcriptional regulator/MocR family aminotransferase